MGSPNSWRRVGRMLSGTSVKRWYKKLIHRKNRRDARRDPEHRDKRLDPWAID